jgi:hypothetical protein
MRVNKRRYIKLNDNNEESIFNIGKEKFSRNLIKYNSDREKVAKNLYIESFDKYWVI